MEVVYQGLLFGSALFLVWLCDRLIAIDPTLKFLEQSRTGFTRFTLLGFEMLLVAPRFLAPEAAHAAGLFSFAISADRPISFLVGVMFGIFVSVGIRFVSNFTRRFDGRPNTHATVNRVLQVLFFAHLPVIFFLPFISKALQPL